MVKAIYKDIIRDIINKILKECMEDNEKRKNSIYGIAEEIKEARLLSEADDEENILDYGMDSLAYIRLIISLEDYFDVEFEDEVLIENKLISVTSFFEAISEILKRK